MMQITVVVVYMHWPSFCKVRSLLSDNRHVIFCVGIIEHTIAALIQNDILKSR